jgi:hypothetical protein
MPRLANHLKPTKVLAASLLLLCAISPYGALAAPVEKAAPAAITKDKTDASCKDFVDKFYAFYLAHPKVKGKPADDETPDLAHLSKYLTPRLYAALKADEDASEKSSDGIVGLDFDPYVNAQEAPDRFVSGKVTSKGATKLVEAYGYWFGKKTKQLDCILELQSENGQWHIANIIYPDGKGLNHDLLSILASLKKDRGGK